MSKVEYIYGYKVRYEEDAQDGASYLEDELDHEEADVFFYYAKKSGKSAPFEDDNDRDFMLEYDDDDEIYVVKKK